MSTLEILQNLYDTYSKKAQEAINAIQNSDPQSLIEITAIDHAIIGARWQAKKDAIAEVASQLNLPLREDEDKEWVQRKPGLPEDYTYHFDFTSDKNHISHVALLWWDNGIQSKLFPMTQEWNISKPLVRVHGSYTVRPSSIVQIKTGQIIKWVVVTSQGHQVIVASTESISDQEKYEDVEAYMRKEITIDQLINSDLEAPTK